MGIPAIEWLRLVEHEYLARFVAGGGSAVKFVVGKDADLAMAASGLQRLAGERGMLFVQIDAAKTRIHMIQNVFFSVAQDIDWARLAQLWVESKFKENGYDWPRPGEPVPLRELGEHNDVAEALLSRDVNNWLTRGIFRDHQMAQDFRSAMVHLCLGRMEPPDPLSSSPVIDWLRGGLKTIGALRDVPVGARITRHNGRAMLRSLCHWVALCGIPGLVIRLDLRQLSSALPNAPGEIRYTPSAVLDAFEVLRQLIDDSDLFEGLFFVVSAGEHLLEGEPRRTIAAYPALRARLESDVRSRRHDNPLAPLVQLAASGTSLNLTAAEMTISTERVAIEALRAGVPNRAATHLLGSDERALEQEFIEALGRVRADNAAREVVAGKLLAGGFGAGKSHLLGYLAEHALRLNFVVSTVSISKETPLFHPERIFAAAMRNAVVPDVNDDVMRVVVEKLMARSEELQRLEAWVSRPEAGFSPIFAALLHVLPKHVVTAEDRAAIAQFFGGARLGIPRVRQWLRAVGSLKLFDLGPVRSPDLALQRIQLAPLLFKAAGFAGWCLLLDELELMARYSALQRGKSYAEISRWLALDRAVAIPGMLAIGALTDDFTDEVFDRRLDQEKVVPLLAARDLGQSARLAEIAMQAIERRRQFLQPPEEAQLVRSLDHARALYATSYGWTPPRSVIGERRAGKPIREFIKSWITGWDIERLYGTTDLVEADPIHPDYSENPDLETPSDHSQEEA